MKKLISLKIIKQRKKSNELIEKIKKGDKKAFEILINDYKEYLYSTAYIHLKNEHDAKDVYQETIYQAIIGIDKLKHPEYFKTWITRILLNNINLLHRKNYKTKDVLNEIEVKDDISYDLIEEKLDLYNAIEQLDIKYKTPIILQYFQDMPIKDISKVLECNENTVKTNIRRGKEMLYKILKEDK